MSNSSPTCRSTRRRCAGRCEKPLEPSNLAAIGRSREPKRCWNLDTEIRVGTVVIDAAPGPEIVPKQRTDGTTQIPSSQAASQSQPPPSTLAARDARIRDARTASDRRAAFGTRAAGVVDGDFYAPNRSSPASSTCVKLLLTTCRTLRCLISSQSRAIA